MKNCFEQQNKRKLYQICIPIPGCNFVQRKFGLFELRIHKGQIKRENTSKIPR